MVAPTIVNEDRCMLSEAKIREQMAPGSSFFVDDLAWMVVVVANGRRFGSRLREILIRLLGYLGLDVFL